MDWSIVSNYWDIYVKGAAVSFQIAILAIICSTIVGYFIALMRLSNVDVLRGTSFVYVWIMRGTPLMLMLFFFYYATPFDIQLGAFAAGLLAMTVNSASFKSEIIRSGIQAVDKGQLEAAEAIGTTPIQKMIRITIPQAVRIILPPYIDNSVIIVKESAQVSIITVPDLMLAAQKAYNSTYSVTETLGVAGVLYLTMTSALMLLQYVCERKLQVKAR